MNTRLWQAETIQAFSNYFQSRQAVKAAILVGSNANASVDSWSDVDLVCVVDSLHVDEFFPDTHWLAAFGDIFGIEQSTRSFTRVTRVCFADFRRVDLVFMPESALSRPENWRYSLLESHVLFSRSTAVDIALRAGTVAQAALPAFDEQQFESMAQRFWFKAAIAVAKVRRNDLLIGLHLALDLARDCLVLAMMLRDVAAGTHIHRYGGPYNEVIGQIGMGTFQPTAQGILDLVVQCALTFDNLAIRLQPTYRRKAEWVQKWLTHD
ncbi:MAG TPA: aminoglycoside 6-adenylyltransferase [Aggregatilineales bacterium]|nr:aminoglycoside 6-adenylyltransferase [Aggregatilineales bacterium]